MTAYQCIGNLVLLQISDCSWLHGISRKGRGIVVNVDANSIWREAIYTVFGKWRSHKKCPMYLNIAASYKNDNDIHILAKVLYIQCNLKQMIQRKNTFYIMTILCKVICMTPYVKWNSIAGSCIIAEYQYISSALYCYNSKCWPKQLFVLSYILLLLKWVVLD